MVAIHPEKRTHKNTAESLAKEPGRIIARMINRDQKEGYAKFNLAPGDTVYWAVDSVKPVSKSFPEAALSISPPRDCGANNAPWCYRVLSLSWNTPMRRR